MKKSVRNIIRVMALFVFGIMLFGISGTSYAEPDSNKNGKEPIYVEDGLCEPYNISMVIPCEERNGLYIAGRDGADEKIWFLSADTGKLEKVFDDSEYNTTLTCSFCQGEKIYLMTRKYDEDDPERPMTIWIYDLATWELESKFKLSSNISFSKLGVDQKGRIYTAKNDSFDKNKGETIYRFDENGQLIDTSESTVRVYHFVAFDPINGNIYFEGERKGMMYPDLWVGRVPANDDFSAAQWKSVNSLYWRTANQGVTSLEDERYLVFSGNSYDTLYVIDSNQYDPAEVDEDTDDNELPICFSLERSDEVSGSIEYVFGNRASYNPKSKSFLVTTDDRHVIDVNLKGDQVASVMETTEHIYSMLRVGDQVLTLEIDDDGKYLMESASIKIATDLKIRSDRKNLYVGDMLQLSVVDDTEDKEEEPEWSTSNPRIATVTKGGCVYGVSKGSVTITAKYGTGVSDTIVLEVDEGSVSGDRTNVYNSKGKQSRNAGENDYLVHTALMTSFLYEEGGYLYRLESFCNYGEVTVEIEKYTLEGVFVQKTRTIQEQCSQAGGFFKGKDAFYLAFVTWDHSKSEADDVLSVVKYDKKWNEIARGSVTGKDIYNITNWGSLRMEEYNEKLYIRTSNNGYVDSAGKHHQSSGTYIFNESDLSHAYMDYSDVSHSFNQFISLFEGKMYMVDHLDGFVEVGPIISVFNADPFTFEKNAVPYEYASDGPYNYDGYSIGGAEVCSDACLIAYNLDINKPYMNRNVYLSITDRNLKYSKRIQLSHYSENGSLTGNPPQLVKVNDDHFLVLWEEYNTKKETTVIRMVLVDADGNICSETGSMLGRLSDCQPIMSDDGYVVWYYTGRTVPEEVQTYDGDGNYIGWTVDYFTYDSAPVFCYVEPYNLPMKCETGWKSDTGGNKFYLNKDGQLLVGVQKIGGSEYLFDENGYIKKGTVKYNGKIYTVDDSGRVISSKKDPDHVHRWDAGVVIKKPTETAEGRIVYTCTCGEQYTGIIPKLEKSQENNTKYSCEWVKGKWYNKDGTQTYKYTMKWRSDKKGWWIVDTKGWYPKNQWQKIDGKWYYFKADGYMASNEWCKGYWLNKNGTWTYKRKAKWKKDKIGWWYGDGKWYAQNQWQKIDGKWYFFDEKGYITTGTRKIGGKSYRFDANGVCLNP